MDDFLKKAIQRLKDKRPIFHSEDDLKFALACEIKDFNENLQVRLERPTDIKLEKINGENKSTDRASFDIIVIVGDKTIPIELKYKTKELKCEIKGEKYDLKEQGAVNIGRYSFFKDIVRIEKYLEKNKSDYGIVLFLTNDKKYYDSNIKDKNTLDKYFYCYNGKRVEKGHIKWNYLKIDQTKDPENKHWTTKGQTSFKIELKNSYTFEWCDYSNIEEWCKNHSKIDERNSFKYCIIEVKNNN